MSLKVYDYFPKEEIYNVISKFLYQVIDENTPYCWYALKQPLETIYSNNSTNYCGSVRIMTLKDLKQIKDELNSITDDEMFSQTKLQELLSHINIDRWETTTQSNCSKYWITYEDLLEEKFIIWKSEKLDLYELYEEEDYLELDILMDGVYQEFFESVSYELYYYKILKQLENTMR